MDLKLAGKVVVVTGATANIGRAIALDFAAEGVKLVAVGRDEDAAKRVIAEASSRGAEEAAFVRADLLDPESPARILEAAEKLGPVCVLVNNVGGNVGAGFFVDSDPASWQGDLDITLMTTLRMTHAVLPGMIARHAGRIVNIGSTAGIVGDYMLPVYSAAKSAVHGFTRVLAKEVGQHGITVNCVAPYGTLSDDPADFSRAAASTRTAPSSATHSAIPSRRTWPSGDAADRSSDRSEGRKTSPPPCSISPPIARVSSLGRCLPWTVEHCCRAGRRGRVPSTMVT